MIYKTKNLENLTVRQLRARRIRLAHELPDIESTLRASLQSQTRRCGKQGCSCAGGEPHGPYIYLSVRTGRRRRLLYIPAGLAEGVKRMVDVSGRIETALTEISAINIELLARGELH